ncbi:MAG: hypothetical protein OXI96_01925, partial [Acidimicrobiaceae bacterium]|nr:hypothetical protein [Acidimicrobiaceae bacterium]
SPTSVANPPIEVSKRPWISSGCDNCTYESYTDDKNNSRSRFRDGQGGELTRTQYETRRTAWTNYDAALRCSGPSCPSVTPPNFPRPNYLGHSLSCDTSSVSDYDEASPSGELASASYEWASQTGCSMSGVSGSGRGTETHEEYHVWVGWNPTDPDWPAQPWPTPKPASYPNGEPRDCVRTNSPPDPPDCTEDDAYCVSWPDWIPDPDLTWQPIDFSLPDNHDPYMGSPYHGPNTHMQTIAADSTHAAHHKASDLNHMSPDVPAATIGLTGGWPSGVTPSSYFANPPYKTENHPRNSSTHHGPDTPPKGAPTLDKFHPDYKPNTNALDDSPLTLVTRLFNTTTEHIGYASDHWDYVMVDPAPLHELCDFMGFKLANVAILAPAGGLIADQWFLPRQTGNNPTIEIQGSITVKHRGLFARSDTNGNLTTGYRKHFTHPTDFEQGTTTWWPDIKQNHWTPQP